MRQIFILMAVVFLVPASVAAQTVTLSGTVSETVALSVTRISLSGDDAQSSVIRVPFLVRSNSGFKISAAVESKMAELAQLSVMNVRATGGWVSPQAVSGLNIPPPLDLRRRRDNASSSSLDISQPFLVVSGPRISLGGTLDSPNNALQITLLIRVKPQPTPDWMVHLTFVATAESLIQ